MMAWVIFSNYFVNPITLDDKKMHISLSNCNFFLSFCNCFVYNCNNGDKKKEFVSFL